MVLYSPVPRSEVLHSHVSILICYILVPGGRNPLVSTKNRDLLEGPTPEFRDFPSICACSESSQKNLIGWQHEMITLYAKEIVPFKRSRFLWSAPAWRWPKERDLWGREWTCSWPAQKTRQITNAADDQEDCGLWRREWEYQWKKVARVRRGGLSWRKATTEFSARLFFFLWNK